MILLRLGLVRLPSSFLLDVGLHVFQGLRRELDAPLLRSLRTLVGLFKAGLQPMYLSLQLHDVGGIGLLDLLEFIDLLLEELFTVFLSCNWWASRMALLWKPFGRCSSGSFIHSLWSSLGARAS